MTAVITGASEPPMIPEERELMVELFEKLAKLEDAERDPEAVEAINQGFEKAPNGAYALVQTVLVQDEALKQYDAYTRQLEQELGIVREPEPRPPGFLGSMRTALFGPREPAHGSVPSVPAGQPGPGGTYAGAQPTGQGGSSFLGNAAAFAAGAIGSSLLFGGMRSMMGGH